MVEMPLVIAGEIIKVAGRMVGIKIDGKEKEKEKQK